MRPGPVRSYCADVSELEDIRLSFDQVPQLYDQIRPTYPNELFDVLFAALPSQPRVLEVGPGTGQATGSLLRRAATVTAVEIGPSLAALLRTSFAAEARLDVINASFESVDVAPGSFDAVVCATAYHWISPQHQVDRPLELLVPGGVLGVIDLIQVESPIDGGYYERVQPIYAAYGQEKPNWAPKSYKTARPKIADLLTASGRYASVEVHRARWDQSYSSSEYRDLLLTFSGTQMMPEPQRSDMLNQLVAVIDQEHDGAITRPLVATLTLAEPAAELLRPLGT